MSRDYQKLLADGASTEELIQVLRDDGFSKVESIKALYDHRQADLAEAKRLVHFSRVWADRRASDEAFWDDLERAFKELDR